MPSESTIESVTVREASAVDHAALTQSLVDAFLDDPVSCWSSPHPGARRKMLRSFFAAYLKAKQKYDLVWTDEDLTGAALWWPPGKWKNTISEDLALFPSMMRPRLFARAAMVGYGLNRTERLHPEKPDHFYLAAIGVAQAGQGRGIGSALMKPVLEICDRDGVPAYLEASKFENVAYYTRRGFRLTGETTLPRGPTVYLMWRDPL
jgi:ribosomal protein S18 acetylase RimI-like enzyme